MIDFNQVQKIAVIGLSPNPDKESHNVAKYLQSKDFTIYPIYPKGDEILGQKVFQSYDALLDSGIRPDLVDVFRKSEALVEVAKDILDAGAKHGFYPKVVWFQHGLRNDEAANLLSQKGIEVIQDACIYMEHKFWTHNH
ncbi:MAG: CoA-binding protein [Helicobacter sp.]|nr:CoA-binding protein [Helicobacter sp.]